jgi:NADH-quinone oxidoreductase subunit M
MMSEFGGLAYNMKVYAVLTIIMVLSSVGLPGLNGFVGEFYILLGAAKTHLWWAIVAASGVILAACYLLRMTQLTFYGPLDKPANQKLKDLNPREAFTLVVLAVAALWIGLYPAPVTRALAPSSSKVVEAITGDRSVRQAEAKEATPGATPAVYASADRNAGDEDLH